MKIFTPLITVLSLATASLSASEPPTVLGQYLEPDKVTKGEVVQLDIPSGFLKFRDFLKQAQEADPEWYKAHQEKAGKENPIPPFDTKLGMTKAEYDKYVALWEQRSYKRIEDGEVHLILKEDGENEWVINISGKGMPVSLLKYIAAQDQFKSSNGTLIRIEDIKSPKESIYREWSGQEWRYFNDGDLVKTKENIAIGRTGDGKYGLLIYSLQELSGNGSPLADDLLMIRFVPKKLQK
ncbi:MAG: hypothetical protein ACSHX6_11940 [Akkermansiaceae bacterium]